MNETCTPLLMEAQPAREQNLLSAITEKFLPDNSEQMLDLCRSRAATPYAELVLYGNELTGSSLHNDALMHVTDNGYTLYDTNSLGNERLLFRTSKDSTFNTKSESAYKYDEQGKLTEVLEHSISPKFETIRKNTVTPTGWKEEQWNRYGTQFNKMPTVIGQTEFKAQDDGSVLRIIRTTDTPMGAVPIGRPMIEVHTVYDVEGRSLLVKRN